MFREKEPKKARYRDRRRKEKRKNETGKTAERERKSHRVTW